MIVLLLAACAPEAAAIRIDAPSPTVHALDPLPLPTAIVLDAAGEALAVQPDVAWTVHPPAIAKVDGALVVPLADGATTLTATTGDVSADWALVVSLPDAILVTGVPDLADVGVAFALVGVAFADGGPLPEVPLAWTSDTPAIATVDARGVVTPLAQGHATLRVAAGAYEEVVAVHVRSPDDRDRARGSAGLLDALVRISTPHDSYGGHDPDGALWRLAISREKGAISDDQAADPDGGSAAIEGLPE